MGGGLKRKVAGLPLYVWLLAGLGLGIAFFIQRMRAKSQSAQDATGLVGFTSTGPTPIYPDSQYQPPGGAISMPIPVGGDQQQQQGAPLPPPAFLGPPVTGGGKGGGHGGGNGGGGGPTSTGTTKNLNTSRPQRFGTGGSALSSGTPSSGPVSGGTITISSGGN